MSQLDNFNAIYDLHEFIDMERSLPFYMNSKDKVAQENPHERVKAILNKGAGKGQDEFHFGEDTTTLYGEGKMLIIHLEFTQDVVVQAMMIKAVFGKQFGSVSMGVYVDKDYWQIYEFGGLQKHDFQLTLLDTQMDGSKSIPLEEWMPQKIRRMTLLFMPPVPKMMLEKMMVYGYPAELDYERKQTPTIAPPIPRNIREEPWNMVMETANSSVMEFPYPQSVSTAKSTISERSAAEMEEGFCDIVAAGFDVVYPDVIEEKDAEAMMDSMREASRVLAL
eukprot:TRINITY_DN3055_c0_g1_i1.p3 TRINITY_DN3055_c0_g1~~TRINITY_DN3055_c0_g1_i1.p3  ORF type:complete len:278 (-),score=46.81 TRINITY_DN3055_c0_g1_i1:1900-2733(-)